MNDHRDQIRIVQETVSGKEITFAHVIGGPSPIIYQKLGLNPSIDYGAAAIGVLNITPSESAIIASDIAVKSGDERIFEVDNVTLEGLDELKAYLEEDIPVRSLDEARARQALGLREWDVSE